MMPPYSANTSIPRVAEASMAISTAAAASPSQYPCTEPAVAVAVAASASTGNTNMSMNPVMNPYWSVHRSTMAINMPMPRMIHPMVISRRLVPRFASVCSVILEVPCL
ncbi:hypothetical protein A4U98_07470 [Bifidobacterium animalis subsp. animalis]|nr:hypothetical protein A4U98_07470 [Bifidobacterium animalis subsp. animalis]PHQ54917.1 hypothetical protein ADH71_003960 [Bifidobacterium animalis subsp. animalis]